MPLQKFYHVSRVSHRSFGKGCFMQPKSLLAVLKIDILGPDALALNPKKVEPALTALRKLMSISLLSPIVSVIMGYSYTVK